MSDRTWTEDETTAEVAQNPSERYQVKGQIGRGAQGTVDRVFDVLLERIVARKTMPTYTTEQQKAALTEAQITARLEHPGVVPVYDVQLEQDQLAYTMAEIKGQPLRDRIQDAGPAERLRLVRVFLDVCETVAFAHSKGLIHRDLKPANIVVGDFGRVVVVDWGLGKALDGDVRATGRVVGTPSYMSPEQARGLAVDTRSDVWSLGAILYELLVGEPPFGGADLRQVLRQVANTSDVKIVSEYVPEDLRAIAEKALRKNPDDRYADARELAADVEASLDGRLVDARSYSVIELLRHTLWRLRWALVWLSAAVGVLVVAGGISLAGILAGANQARIERDRAYQTLAGAHLAWAQEALRDGNLSVAGLHAATTLQYRPSDISARGVLALGEALVPATRIGGVAPLPCLGTVRVLGGTGRAAVACGGHLMVVDERNRVLDQTPIEQLSLDIHAGNDFVAVRQGGRVRLWSVDTTGRLIERDLKDGARQYIASAPDVLTLVGLDGSFSRIQGSTGEVLQRHSIVMPEGVLPSSLLWHNGSVWARNKDGAVVWNADTQTWSETFVRPANITHTLFVGGLRVEVLDNGRVYIYEESSQDGNELPTVYRFGNLVTLLPVSSDWIALSSGQSGVDLYQLSAKRTVHLPAAGDVLRVAQLSEQDFLVTARNESVVWRLNDAVVVAGAAVGFSSCVSKEGEVACGTFGEVVEVDLHGIHRVLLDRAALVKDLDYSDNGILVAYADQTGGVWEVSEGSPSRRLTVGDPKYPAVRRLVSSTQGVMTAGYAAVGVYVDNTRVYPQVNNLERSADGRRVLLGDDEEVRILEGEEVVSVFEIEELSRAITLNTDGTKVAYVDGSGVKIYAVNTGVVLSEWEHSHLGEVGGVSFSPDGRYLATADWNGRVIVHNVVTAEEMLIHDAHSARVDGLGWLNNTHLVTAGWDSKIFVIDLEAADTPPVAVANRIQQMMGIQAEVGKKSVEILPVDE